MFRRLSAPILVLAALLALSACTAGNGVPTPTTIPSTPTTAAQPTTEPTSEPTTQPTAEPTAEPTTEPTTEPTMEATAEPTAFPDSSTVFTFLVTGGIAGMRTQLDIAPGGEATVSIPNSERPSVTVKLPPDVYGALLDRFRESNFFDLEEKYDNGNFADDIYYTITVRQGDRTKTVAVAQVGGQGLTPAPLQALIDQLTNIQKGINQ